MFDKIVSVSGKSGLFNMISQSKNITVVESLVDGKRQPAFQDEKIVMLNEIAMYTDSGETSLRTVLKNAFKLEEGKKIVVDAKSSPDVLREYFAKVLPNFDKERIYPTDIKKFILWYNLLVEKNIIDFMQEPEAEENEETAKTGERVKLAEAKHNTTAKSVQKSTKANSTSNRQTTRVSNKKGS